MASLSKLSTFRKIYDFWDRQEQSALITMIETPNDVWEDIAWTRNKTLNFAKEENSVKEYFRLLRLGHFPKRGKLHAANKFYRGRIRGIGYIVLFNKYWNILSDPLPNDPIYDCVEALRERFVKEGAFKKAPALIKQFPLEIMEIYDNLLRLELEKTMASY